MFFVLQKENKQMDLDIDILTLKQELNRQKFQHEYCFLSLEELDPSIKGYSIKNLENAVPIGTIDFVSAYLKKFHNVENLNPIEVPNELRLEKFLQRKYSIIEGKDIPTKGNYFLKNVSKLKSFSYSGNLEYLMYDEIFNEPKKHETNLHLKKDDLFQLSEIKKILSEYRVFVINDNIEGIQFYDGDPCLMPTPDEIKTLKEMISRYMLDQTRPMAYTLDIAIIKTNDLKGRNIMILECHPFSSIGLYGFDSPSLPYAYRYGVDWYIKHNTKIEKFN